MTRTVQWQECSLQWNRCTEILLWNFFVSSYLPKYLMPKLTHRNRDAVAGQSLQNSVIILVPDVQVRCVYNLRNYNWNEKQTDKKHRPRLPVEFHFNAHYNTKILKKSEIMFINQVISHFFGLFFHYHWVRFMNRFDPSRTRPDICGVSVYLDLNYNAMLVRMILRHNCPNLREFVYFLYSWFYFRRNVYR